MIVFTTLRGFKLSDPGCGIDHRLSEVSREHTPDSDLHGSCVLVLCKIGRERETDWSVSACQEDETRPPPWFNSFVEKGSRALDQRLYKGYSSLLLRSCPFSRAAGTQDGCETRRRCILQLPGKRHSASSDLIVLGETSIVRGSGLGRQPRGTRDP